MPSTLVLVRHGESTWNKENRFTGWIDVELSTVGREEATQAGRLLASEKLKIDLTFTSVLKRALQTHYIVTDIMNQLWLPVERSWRLNERHYGALQGLNKAETAALHGEDQVKIWRRSFDVPPPPLAATDPTHPTHDIRYRDVDPKVLPSGESLKQVVERFTPFWNETLRPHLQAGKNLMVVAHGNSLRAFVQILENLSREEILELNIPTAIPLVYKLDLSAAELKIVSKNYLGSADEVAARLGAVANQGKAKT